MTPVRLLLGLFFFLLVVMPAAAGGLVFVPLACTGSTGPRAATLLFVDEVFAGLRLEAAPAKTYVMYGENEQGMALVDALEHGLDNKADLASYSAVLQVSTGNVVRMRAREGFVAALLTGEPVGAQVEVLTCTPRPEPTTTP